PPVAVVVGPSLLDIVGGIGRVAPLVAVLGDLAAAVEVVEQHIAAGQGVRVGGGLLAEQGQRRVAVSRLYIAEHLIGRAVFANDIGHVPDLVESILQDRRAVAAGVACRTGRRIGGHLAGISRKLGLVRDIHHGDRAAQDVADVVVLALTIVRRLFGRDL